MRLQISRQAGVFSDDQCYSGCISCFKGVGRVGIENRRGCNCHFLLVGDMAGRRVSNRFRLGYCDRTSFVLVAPKQRCRISRERMILPWSPNVEGGEIRICYITRPDIPSQARNINSNISIANLSDDSMPNTVFSSSNNAEHAIKEPDRTCGVKPIDVEIEAKSQNSVVPASHDDEDGHEDVKDEENLIRETTKVEVAQYEHGADENGGDDSPEPEWIFG